MIGKKFFSPMCHKTMRAKVQRSNARGTFSNSGLNGRGYRKNVRLQRKTGHISETVKDTAKVTIDHY